MAYERVKPTYMWHFLTQHEHPVTSLVSPGTFLLRHEDSSPFLILENVIQNWVCKAVVAVIQCQQAVKGSKVKQISKSCSSRAGLQCPVGRIHRLDGRCCCTERVGAALQLLRDTLRQTFCNWPVTLLVTRRSVGSISVACIWSFVITSSWTYCCQVTPSLKAVFCRTSKLHFCLRRPRTRLKIQLPAAEIAFVVTVHSSFLLVIQVSSHNSDLFRIFFPLPHDLFSCFYCTEMCLVCWSQSVGLYLLLFCLCYWCCQNVIIRRSHHSVYPLSLAMQKLLDSKRVCGW
jgi:hypothetical protein